MKNTYVLDTSALIYDPLTYKQFGSHNVVIPIAVLNELDKLKKQSNDAGRNARGAVRLLDEISNLGDISTGILLDNDIMLKVDASYIDLSLSEYQGLGDPTYGDTQILACAQATQRDNPNTNVILISNDINLRVKAKSRGLNAEAHQDKSHSLTDVYSGLKIIVNEDAGLDLQQFGQIDPENYSIELEPNECVLFEDQQSNEVALGRLVGPNKIKLVKKQYPWSISSRNNEQTLAIDLMMDPNIDLITMIGKAGTGKSLIVLAAALELVLSRKEYDKLIIYRPIQAVGADIGFLPGTLQEKLAPWFVAIMDNFELLFSNKNGGDWKRDLEMYQKKGKIEMEAITYIRGRSIPNAIILIDEAQNISKQDIKTILTRVGEGTKIILNGDIEQIDNDQLNAVDNGLIHVIENFKSSKLAGHITFTQGERSRLATIASQLL